MHDVAGGDLTTVDHEVAVGGDVVGDPFDLFGAEVDADAPAEGGRGGPPGIEERG